MSAVFESIVKILIKWDYRTGYKEYKYVRVRSWGVFIVNEFKYNFESFPASEEEWKEQEERERKARIKPEPRHIKVGEKVINPWK